MARQRKFEGREEIAEAALEIIDADGLATLTMRGVGRALGVEAMTLYGYVRNRDELLDAVQALLLRDLFPDESDRRSSDWVEDAIDVARRFRARLMEHPNAVPIVATRPATEPEALDVIEACLRVIPPKHADDAADIVQTLFVFVVGHCSFHAALASLASVPPALDAERHPTLARTRPSTAEAEFEAGLRVFAAGLRSSA